MKLAEQLVFQENIRKAAKEVEETLPNYISEILKKLFPYPFLFISKNDSVREEIVELLYEYIMNQIAKSTNNEILHDDVKEIIFDTISEVIIK